MKRLLPALLTLAACQPSKPAGAPTPPAQQFRLLDMIGGWRWILRTEEQGTSRVEEERWRFRADTQHPARLLGRYVRTVEVRSLDRVPFQCNQRPWYRQRAIFDVVADIEGKDFVIHETGYTTEPSPCDHGFRHLGSYRVRPQGGKLTLAFDGGTQTLWQLDNLTAELPPAPWADHVDPYGPWRWDATSYDDDGNIRDESEWWEITKRTDTRFDATYRRRVTVRSPDGSPIACAGAPSWSFDDAYVLDGQREEEHWHLYERAVEPGDHPCLRATPKRTLDEATAEQIGDFFILEWRGKRHQVLYRAEPSPRGK